MCKLCKETLHSVTQKLVLIAALNKTWRKYRLILQPCCDFLALTYIKGLNMMTQIYWTCTVGVTGLWEETDPLGTKGGVELRGQAPVRPRASSLNGPPVQLKHWPRDGTLERDISSHQELEKIHLQEPWDFLPQEYVSNYNILCNSLIFKYILWRQLENRWNRVMMSGC